MSIDEVSDLLDDVEGQAQKTRKEVHSTEHVVARLQGTEELGTQSAQEIAAHSASDVIEHLTSSVKRARSAMERPEDVRQSDLGRALGEEDDGKKNLRK